MPDQHPGATDLMAELEQLATPEQLSKYERSFPLPQRGGDVFIGVPMGQVFALAKRHIDLPLVQVEQLLESDVHEARVCAVSIMDFQARRKTTDPERRGELFELYLRRHDCINTWDLVDRSAIHVIGRYLMDRPRDVLRSLAGSEQPMERRTAMVSTMYFISKGDTGDAFAIAELLLQDPDPLVQKAAGWALRTAGGEGLMNFLDRYAAVMPRAMLRNAVEKLEPARRKYYLGLSD